MFDLRSIRLHTKHISGNLGFSKEANTMSIARVTELSATSETSFEDAINAAVARATKTLRGVEGAWVKDMNVSIEDGNIKAYRVNLEITFQLEDPS
jgi:dodecin